MPATSDFSPTATDGAVKPAAALDEALAAIAGTCESAHRVYVGFSGGLDSTVLLHAVARAFPQKVAALHGHHGLHGDADRWAKHCRDVCVYLKVPFEARQLQVVEDGHGPEAAARDARYRWFAEVLKAGDVLLLAHHLDDQVETLLLRLLRGAGPDGLGAMPSCRAIGDATLLRPFLDLPRSVLRGFAEDADLRWVDDPSNDTSRFDRNYLRNDVLPLVAERWPGYRKTLGRAASQLRALAEVTAPVPMETVHSVVGDPGFALEGLPEESAVASLAIRQWLKARGIPMPTATRLQEFQRQLEEGQGASLVIGRYELTRYRQAVYLRARTETQGPPVETLVVGEQHCSKDYGKLRLSKGQSSHGPDRLFVRCRKPGDRIAIAGGQHRDLKDVFQEQGVPPWWRDRVPLICTVNAGEEVVLAVGPYCRAPLAEKLGIGVHWTPALGLAD